MGHVGGGDCAVLPVDACGVMTQSSEEVACALPIRPFCRLTTRRTTAAYRFHSPSYISGIIKADVVVAVRADNGEVARCNAPIGRSLHLPNARGHWLNYWRTPTMSFSASCAY
jgi:hypothetical protein